MANYYDILGVAQDATADEIADAYERQRERYRPERVADLDPELRRVAEERSAELRRAFDVLSNPERRRSYDASLTGRGAINAGEQAKQRGSLTRRERTMALAGALVAIALIAGIWVLTGRSTTPQGTAMAKVDRPAPAFTLPALSGGNVNLADYSGKVVLLNFWGTWCEPCQRELPALEQAHQAYGDRGLVIIGVNLTHDEQAQGSSQARISEFLKQHGVTYPIALDVQGEVTNAYRVFPLPTSFFIDPEGRIRYVHISELTYDDIAAKFNELSGESPAASVR